MAIPHIITVEDMNDMGIGGWYFLTSAQTAENQRKLLQCQIGGTNWRCSSRPLGVSRSDDWTVVCEGTPEDCVKAYNDLG